MRTGVESIKFLNSLGYNDRIIGEWYDVSREHINRIKNGKEQGSKELIEQLHDECEANILYTQESINNSTQQYESKHISDNDAIEAVYTNIDTPTSQELVPYTSSEQPVQYISYPPQPREIIKHVPVYIEKPANKQIKPTVYKKPYNPTLLPLDVRKWQRREWKQACKLAKRQGLPIPPKPSIFEETPVTETNNTNLAFKPKQIEAPMQQTYTNSLQLYEQNTYRTHTDF